MLERAIRALFIALAMMASTSRVEAGPPDFCEKLKASYFERDCCIADSRNCQNIRVAWDKRDCPIGDPCFIGCGTNVCLAYLGEECCNLSCSNCAPPGVVCPAEICE